MFPAVTQVDNDWFNMKDVPSMGGDLFDAKLTIENGKLKMDSGTLNFGAGAISGAKVLRVTPLNDGKMFMKKGRAPWSVTDLQRAVYPGRTKADFKLAQPKAAPGATVTCPKFARTSR